LRRGSTIKILATFRSPEKSHALIKTKVRTWQKTEIHREANLGYRTVRRESVH
jgi:hypothetical protein